MYYSNAYIYMSISGCLYKDDWKLYDFKRVLQSEDSVSNAFDCSCHLNQIQNMFYTVIHSIHHMDKKEAKMQLTTTFQNCILSHKLWLISYLVQHFLKRLHLLLGASQYWTKSRNAGSAVVNSRCNVCCLRLVRKQRRLQLRETFVTLMKEIKNKVKMQPVIMPNSQTSCCVCNIYQRITVCKI